MISDEDILELESNGHSLFGGSKSHRIRRCTGSLLAEIGLPDTAGYEAAEGTLAHDIAYNACYQGLELPDDFEPWVGTTHTFDWPTGIYEVPVTMQMLNHLAEYVQWVRAVPGEHYFEQRVDYSRLTPIPRQGGTADALCFAPHHLTVTDLKYGGVRVYAEENDQMSLYALGAIYEWDWLYDFEQVTLRIGQPRLNHWDTWETTKTDLLAWAEQTKVKFAESWQPNAPRTPGEIQCKWCKARPTCAAHVRLMDNLADDTFEDMSVPAIRETMKKLGDPDFEILPPEIMPLTTLQLAKVLQYRKPIEDFLRAAYTELSRRVLSGADPMPPGWMMAEGRLQRGFVSQDAALKKVRELGYSSRDIFKTEMLSPSSVEALLVADGYTKGAAKKFLSPVVVERPGVASLTLAKPGKRVAIDLADDTFEDESET